MDKQEYFERNLLALARFAPLCSGLTKAQTTLGRYKFLDSRSGLQIPAWVDPSGSAHPLHSMVDPYREAERLIQESGDGFIILMGLGAGFQAQQALELESTAIVLAIDYDINSIAELLCHTDYVKIFSDPRFHLLADPNEAVIEKYILNLYRPALHGGIRTIPLRARTSGDTRSFGIAKEAVENAIGKISADYSVQSYFGTRWFSNMIRNLSRAGISESPLPPIKKAAVTAAGPSLDLQLNQIRERKNEFFLIATDTSLPCLLSADIKPDAVVSIDCQHIGYYHFLSGIPKETILFMDLASPPPIASCTENTRYFCGNHPLASYIRQNWRSLPEVDTSGGNVTYSAVALAEKLGAQSIELYGADFSYPEGLTYAGETYIHQLFANKQKRLAPLEAQHSAFLYRGPLVKKTEASGWYYESPSLKFYREKLQEKSKTMEAELLPQQGIGAPIMAPVRQKKPEPKHQFSLFTSGRCQLRAEEFLGLYRDNIGRLPFMKNTAAFQTLRENEKQIFTTILPAAAAIKRRNPGLTSIELIEETKKYCLKEIEKVLNSGLYSC